jgi:hypothetical protein
VPEKQLETAFKEGVVLYIDQQRGSVDKTDVERT